jgi:SRSO17 transposase
MEEAMDLQSGVETSESRFAAYVEALSSAIGHADRVAPLKAYCTGLILPGERKSVEPMAARVEPGRVQAAHQSLHHFVAKADWSDAAVLAVVRAQVLPIIEAQGPIRAWIVDDTGFPKKGRHSIGVARQYCGQLGKQDNCQIAVSLSVANNEASLPIGYRLYLPEAWANDPDRRTKAGVPEDVTFRTKPEIALGEIEAALAAGVPRGVVLADAGYGIDTAFRIAVTALGLTYVVGIQSSTSLWPPVASRCRPKRGAAAGVRHRWCVAIPSTSRFRPRNWRRPCPKAPGTGSPGGRARMLRSPRASPPCASGRRIGITGAPHRDRRNGSWSSGRRARANRPNIGSPPCHATRRSPTSSTRPSCAGASSGTIRSSSRRSASVTTKAAAGEASTITPRSPSPPTDSWSPSGV